MGATREEAVWRKSSFSAERECVELALDDGAVLARNSKHPDGAVLSCPPAVWRTFLAGVVSGELDA